MTTNANGPQVAETPRGRDNSLGGGSEDTVQPGHDIAQQLRRRRAAAYRLPPLECGHRDPLDCRRSCRERRRT